MNYFGVYFQEDPNLGVGYLRDDRPLYFAPREGMITDWLPLVLELRGGEYPDYLASDFGGRICSERMRTLLDRHASASDVLQWLDVLVVKGEQERPYFYLHFPSPPAVLHPQRTIFAGQEMVVKPVISEIAAANHQVFTFPRNHGVGWVVAEVVRDAIVRAGLTGCEVSRIASA